VAAPDADEQPLPTSTQEETLAWEAERRSRTAIFAFLAAALTIAGALVTGLGRGVDKHDDRAVTVIDALARRAAGQPIPQGRLSAQVLDLADHAALEIVGAIFFCLGTLCIFPVAAFLFRAARARRPELQQMALVLAAIGAVGFAVGRTSAEISQYIGALHFRDAVDHSNQAANDALTGTGFLIGQIAWQAGALALGFAFVLICLNAMRVGLLSRFMGVLGIIVGATFVLPLDQQGIIRVFWLAAIGALIMGRWPSMPPAWTTGKAEPWPTQQEMRERREAQRLEREPAAAEPRRPERPAPVPAAPSPRRADPAAGEPHSASKKRKRKRRS
jgi:hypothetical protein